MVKKYISLVLLSFSLVSVSERLSAMDLDLTPFTPDERASIEHLRPVLPPSKEMTDDFLKSLFAGPEEINGRAWSLAKFEDSDKFRRLISNPFRLRTLSDDSDQFIIEPFDIDSEGQIRFQLLLMPQMATYVLSPDGTEQLDLSETDHLFLHVQTPLTEDELALPIVRRLQLPYPFEEWDRLDRRAHENDVSGDINEQLQKEHFVQRVLRVSFTLSQLLRDPDDRSAELAEVQAMFAAATTASDDDATGAGSVQ